jgi:hypothetical protein
MSTALVSVKITPTMMAAAFWGMNSDEQTEFFDELAQFIQQDKTPGASTYGMGELQWHYLASAMQGKKYDQPRAMLMSMAAPLYLHTLTATERAAS